MISFVSSRRSFLMGAAIATTGVSWSSHSARAQSAPIRLRVSSSLTTDEYSEHYSWFLRFSDNLQKTTGNKIKLDYYPDGQLGNENDVVQQVRVGTVDMMISGSPTWATLVPEMGMLDLAYLFDSYDQAQKHLLHGSVGSALAGLLHERTKVTLLGFSSLFGSRNVFTKRRVASLDDLQGLKIRVLPVPIFIQSLEAMGAVPTPIGMNELYTSLQTGVVDGLEHNVCTVLAGKYYEVAKNCFETEHMFTALAAVASARAMAKIPAEMQPAFLAAAQEASAYQYTQTPTKVKKATDELIKVGMTFTPMSADDRLKARQAVKTKVWQAFLDKYPLTKPLVDEIDADRA